MGTNKTLKALAGKLNALGVATVIAQYDGLGDAGDVCEINFTDKNEKAVAVNDDLEEKSIDIVIELISLRFGGWELNSGSYGSVKLDLCKKSVSYEHFTRIEAFESDEENAAF